MSGRRALHFVFKIGDRAKTAIFYRDILGMKFLRHEEFEGGCVATCNGPYDGKWSKSMVGYGSEDAHFVVELTYNYGIGAYKLGTDFRGLTVHSERVLEKASAHNWPVLQDNGGATYLEAPGGYRFYIVNKPATGDPMKTVSLASSNLPRSIEFWRDKCGMKLFSQGEKSASLGFSEDQCRLELVDIGKKVDHGTAFGRIAFSCPASHLPELEALMKGAGETIIKSLVSLDTPGKATVQVVILADPDGHEICFVGDEAYRELSQLDVHADDLLNKAMSADKSDEWFAKKGKTKVEAS